MEGDSDKMGIADLTADSFYELNTGFNRWMHGYNLGVGLGFMFLKYIFVLPVFLYSISTGSWVSYSDSTKVFFLGIPVLLAIDLLALIVILCCRNSKKKKTKKNMALYMVYLFMTLPFLQSSAYFQFVKSEGMSILFVIGGIGVLLLGGIFYYLSLLDIRNRLLLGRYKRDSKLPAISKKERKIVAITFIILLVPLAAFGGNSLSRRASMRISEATSGVFGALLLLYAVILFLIIFEYLAARFTWSAYFFFQKRFLEEEVMDYYDESVMKKDEK